MGEYRRDVPLEAWFAAKLIGTLAEDCGPCTRLVVRIAERQGVQTSVLRNLIAGKADDLPEDARTGYCFAQATLAHDPDAGRLREKVIKQWGRRALVSLALAVTTARVYPTLKYSLGHALACSRIRVGDTDVPVRRTTKEALWSLSH
jgi:hypothetical protein